MLEIVEQYCSKIIIQRSPYICYKFKGFNFSSQSHICHVNDFWHNHKFQLNGFYAYTYIFFCKIIDNFSNIILALQTIHMIQRLQADFKAHDGTPMDVKGYLAMGMPPIWGCLFAFHSASFCSKICYSWQLTTKN